MSRPSSISQRPLTLTEELEKLEQSITLTLQEIDQNFSQAHRIVTTSILPLVEQYAEHSRDVWEGAKFWKQFFEASANVSLSGYEERPDEDTTQDQTVTEDSTDVTHSNLTDTASYETPSSERLDINHGADDLELTSLNVSSHSTPRVASHERPHDDTTITSAVSYTSPYESLKQEIHETDPPFDMDESTLPSTPGRPPRLHDYAGNPPDTLMSSPFVPPASHEQPSGARRNPYQKTSDPVMHRVLDKTYRVQATPLGKGYSTTSRSKFTVTPKVSKSKYALDDSPMSSPEPEAPQLHAEIFSSPLKATTPGTSRKRRPSGHLRITPKPGMSVLTPAKPRSGKHSAWDSDEEFDDEEDENFGPSPPKTMQFHIPQSRLMKTPAKEASKRIVEDLLFTAGVNDTTDDIDEQSPSVIRRVERLEDETF